MSSTLKFILIRMLDTLNELGTTMQESDVLKKLESIDLKRQIEQLSTFLPDEILKSPDLKDLQTFSAILLHIEVSGFTSICEKYNKVGNGGICRLTATLNAHAGVIMEIINFYGGDLLKFTGEEYLACWRVAAKIREAVHNVIVCALFIHDQYGCFDTEINVPLKLKLAICYGDVDLYIFGGINKHYAVLGGAVNDVKFAKCISSIGDVVVSADTWKKVSPKSYEHTASVGGFIKVWNCVYESEEASKSIQSAYEEKEAIVEKLCLKHLDHRSTLHKKKSFGDTLTDIDITDNFIVSLPVRPTIKLAAKHWQIYDIKPFVYKLVQNQVDERQPIEDLTEMREVTIQYISVTPVNSTDQKFLTMMEKVYREIENATNKCLGVITNVSFLDKDFLVIVVFGLRRYRYELESKNALVSAYKIYRVLSNIDHVKIVSVGISNGLVYSGIVGHPMRKEFLVAGKVVNRAGRMMCTFPSKVTCDHKTYRLSKLSSYYFQLQSIPNLKGATSSNVFEYNEDFKEPLYTQHNLIIIGREEESDLISTIINQAHKVNYYGVCFHGREKIGKSTLIQSQLVACQRGDYTLASIELCRNTQRPYFCVSNLYKQLYNQKSRIDSDEFIFVKDLPSDLWDFGDILQRRSHTSDLVCIQRKFKILNLFREITKNSKLGFVVLFIDNIQYIDVHSFDILETIVKEKYIRLVCAGQFEEDFWDIRWKISLNNHVKLLELGPLKFRDIYFFISTILRVSGVPSKLVKILKSCCDGVPGMMEHFVLKLMNEGHLEIKYLPETQKYKDYNFLDDDELQRLGFNSGTDRRLGCVLSDDFVCPEKITMSALFKQFLDSYDSFHLSLIKISSVLGDIFNRSLLTMVFKYPSQFVFMNAIKNLFHQDIFECGTKYLSPIGLVPRTRYCCCLIDSDERRQNKTLAKLPKYAFCKVIHFKNKVIREIAYNMLEEEQKKELNLKVTDILEHQNNSCSNCLRNNTAPIVLIPRFREIFLMCNVQSEMQIDGKISFTKEPENIESVINKGLQSKAEVKKASKGTYYLSKRKIWDSSICYCLEILIKVYQDLVYHSKEAGHLEKVIYFLMQNGFIMILMNEFQDAIPILEEAVELCKIGEKNLGVTLSETFRNVHVAKINLLRAEAYLNLGNIPEARKHLLESLKQYEISLVPYNNCTRIFGVHIFSKNSYRRNKLKAKSSMFKSDFGTCLNLVSNLFAVEGDWNMAKVASTQCISFLSYEYVNMNVLCDIFSNAISIYNYCGDADMCEKLEKYVSQHILKKFNSNATLELFAISKLIYTIFQTRFLNAKIETAIRLGYRALDLNNNIHAHDILIDVITTLSGALLLIKRIEDSVEVAKILHNIGKTRRDHGLLAYYVYSLELILETSFTLEPLDKIMHFGEAYFDVEDKSEFSTTEKSLLIFLYDSHLRNNRWIDVHKWKSIANFGEFQCTSVQSAKNLFRYTEAIMISYVKNEMFRKHKRDAEFKVIEKYLKQCKGVSEKWRIFRPRYLHYKAYYCKIRNRKVLVKKYLKKANIVAEEQGNILERCWLTQSENFWNCDFSFEGEKRYVDWKLVKAYSPVHWSQILYGLPWHP